jgi:F0F1-type ATP synthase assembly protein I
MFLGRPTILLGILAAVLSLFAHVLCLLPMLLGWNEIIRHAMQTTKQAAQAVSSMGHRRPRVPLCTPAFWPPA